MGLFLAPQGSMPDPRPVSAWGSPRDSLARSALETGAAFLLVAFVRAGRLASEWALLLEGVSAQMEALSALWALSATLSRPGGPNNAAELNGSSRWALLDVREAKKIGSAYALSGFPLKFSSGRSRCCLGAPHKISSASAPSC